MTSLGACFTTITKQMSRLCIHQRPNTASISLRCVSRPLNAISLNNNDNNLGRICLRSFSRKIDKKSNKKSVKTSTPSKEEVSLQHIEWVNFQKSIAVDGFETGQTTQIRSGKKSRGRKSSDSSRLSAAELKIAERQRLTDVGGGQYPPMRYSDEETEQLLNEAYAALPERAGKRGTRNIKRQKIRWSLVRKIRKKYKSHIVNNHFRMMEKRSQKIEKVKAVLLEAPTKKERDRQYQAEVLRYWMSVMAPDAIKIETSEVLQENEISGSK